MSKSIFYWLEKPETITTTFRCEDFEEFEQLLETLARGRNVRGSRHTYKCGWVITDETGGDFRIECTVQQAIVIQMMGYDI